MPRFYVLCYYLLKLFEPIRFSEVQFLLSLSSVSLLSFLSDVSFSLSLSLSSFTRKLTWRSVWKEGECLWLYKSAISWTKEAKCSRFQNLLYVKENAHFQPHLCNADAMRCNASSHVSISASNQGRCIFVVLVVVSNKCLKVKPLSPLK